MVRHIVLFKLIPFETPEAKTAKMMEIKARLEALKAKIDCLHFIQVDFNINPAEPWDIVLTTELDSLDALHAYATHPDHVAVSKEVIAPVKADRACIDYRF